ncbi:MAG: hypothetical protein AAB569_02765 [Patescibacteria group bacterium]
MALEKKAAVQKRLPPGVFDSLMGSANLANPFFLEETAKFPGSVDKTAEKMQYDYQMNGRFVKELKARKGFSDEVMDWKFEQFTGIRIVRSKAGSKVSSDAEPLAIGVGVHLRTNLPKVEQQEIRYELANPYPEFENWPEPEGPSPLQTMIAQAKKDSEANLFGGGLPPVELVVSFHKNVFIPAFNATMDWSDYDINLIHNYPDAGAAPEHRNLVIDNFLGEKERDTIRKNFTREKQSDGLFFTYGSQEALSYMLGALADKNNATAENPVELVVTDPTYPGLLMAADKFLKKGLIKFRVVSINEDTGEIDIDALKSALNHKRCKAFYLAEGNPLPKKIANLEKVAEVLRMSENEDKTVFEDRAYLGLGATDSNSLFHLLDNRVVAFETFSKKGSPGRTGLVYSNMEPGKFAFITDAMLNNQYNEKLGYSGVLSGEIAAILRYNLKTQVFTKHIQEVQAYYEKQRALYEKSYREALDLAFGEGKYNLDDEVIIAKDKFMFGWRNTYNVPADRYAKIGSEIKLFSLSGSACRPKQKDIAEDQPSDFPSLHHLRQNYTWIKPKNLQIGIYKDVLLEVILTNRISSTEEKRSAVEKLSRKLIELNDGDLPEIGKFIKKVQENGWKYPEETSS